MHSHRVLLLAMGCMVGSLTLLARSASAPQDNDFCAFFQSQPQTPTTFCYANVPDLDQRRSVGNILPRKGEMYCAPTTAIDWIIRLCVEDGLCPVEGLSQERLKAKLDSEDYYFPTQLIYDMGQDMGTSPSDPGTLPSQIESGITTWLNANLSSNPVNTVAKAFLPRVQNVAPVLEDMAKTVVEYKNKNAFAYIIAMIGWYQPSTRGDPSKLSRSGGHFVPLTAAWVKPPVLYGIVGINDPDWPPSNDPGPPQNPYTTNVYLTRDVSLTICPDDSCESDQAGQQTMTHLVGLSQGNGYIDGAFEILPVLVASNRGNESVGALTTGLRISQSLCKECTIRALAIDSLARIADYLTESGDIYTWNPISGQATRITPDPIPGALHLAVGGYSDSIYVSRSNDLLRFSSQGKPENRAELPQGADAIAFDELHQRLVSISRTNHTMTAFSSDLQPLSAVTLKRDVCDESESGAIRLSISERSGNIWARCDGSSTASMIDSNGTVQTTVKLGENASGLFVNGQEHIFVSVNGQLVEFNSNGGKVEPSYFTEISVGEEIQFSRSVSNIDLRLLRDPAYRNVTT